MIIDIDFRHVMRAVPAPEFGEGIGRMTPVLQWRKKVHMPIPDQPELPEGVPPLLKPEPEWTDWQDVRTETE